jgi:6-pyruvoyltetrahydropterin/6-carboxytetrahydropterin synthase
MPHGHTYHLRVYCEGDLVNVSGDQEEGMVMDFGFLRELIERHIKEVYDHRTCLWNGDELVAFLRDAEEDGHIPEGSVVGVNFIPTAENLAQHFFNLLYDLVHLQSKGRVDLKKVTLFETPTSSASVTEPSYV